MPYAPLISKIRCHNPNAKKSQNYNRNYLIYIATREGVDLTNPSFEKHLQEEMNLEAAADGRADGDGRAAGDEKPEAGNELYLKYISERPLSHGLFGNINTDDLNQLGRQIAKMTAERKNIYRGIVSLSEKDADNLGFLKKEAWIDYMKTVMPDIGNEFGIKSENLNWCAAVHMAKGHPHCHYMFWDTSSRICSSFIHPSVQAKCRQLLSKEMFQAERAQEIISKTNARDFILEFGKSSFQELRDEMAQEYRTQHPEVLPGKMGAAFSQAFKEELKLLISELPASGRITYAYMPPETKNHVDSMTKLLLSHPDIQKQVMQYYQSTENISDTYSASEKSKEWAKDKASRDLEKRIGNIILTTAKEIRKEMSRTDYRNQKLAEYNEMRRQALIEYGCYSVFRNVFASVMQKTQEQSILHTGRQFQAHSKENMKIYAKIHKNSPEHDEPDI